VLTIAPSCPAPPSTWQHRSVLIPERHALADLVRELHQRNTRWQPAGAATRLDWGPPLQPGPAGEPPQVLSVRRLDRILEHNPGDFTITLEAGAPLAAVQEALAEHRQWLAVDPAWGSAAGGSVGGLVARGMAGGYRQRYLGLRDQLIGIAVLRTDGVLARAGGRVVKNVAGYDLMRLFCGSWGSLGLITELTLRTQPLPPERRGLLVQGPLPQLAALARWLLGSSLSPERVDWWSAPLAAAAGLAAEPLLLLGLASVSPATLEEQIACLREQTPLPARSLSPEALAELLALGRAAHEAEPAWLLRLGVSPDQASELLAAAELAPLRLELAAGSGLGMAWASAPEALSASGATALRQRCQALGGFLTVLRQPAGTGLDAWPDAPSRPVIEAVKARFDPLGQLAPGRLPGVARPLAQQPVGQSIARL
jgi:glycolate oxidase FAD binding subunit